MKWYHILIAGWAVAAAIIIFAFNKGWFRFLTPGEIQEERKLTPPGLDG